LLDKPITVSSWRKKPETLHIDWKTYQVFPVYYPVGQGTRNINMAKEDIDRILKSLVGRSVKNWTELPKIVEERI
jgi:hypothetical protein